MNDGTATWVKLRTDFFSDDRVKLVRNLPEGDTLIVLYFEMLALAGRCNDGGRLMIHGTLPHDQASLTSCLGKSASVISLAIGSFLKYGLLHETNDGYEIADWYADQNSEKLAALQEAARKRQANYRQRISTQKLLPEPTNVTRDVTRDVTSNVTRDVTASENDALRYGDVTVTPQSKNRVDKSREEQNRVPPVNPSPPQGYVTCGERDKNVTKNVTGSLQDLNTPTLNPTNGVNSLAAKWGLDGQN
jgi:predicted phage replisome organizer